MLTEFMFRDCEAASRDAFETLSQREILMRQLWMMEMHDESLSNANE